MWADPETATELQGASLLRRKGGLLRLTRFQDAQDDECAIVVRFRRTATELICGSEDRGRNVFRRFAGCEIPKNVRQTIESESFVFRVHGFQDAIGGEHQDVRWLEGECHSFILNIRKHAEGSSIDLDFLNFTIAEENRARSAGIGNDQLTQGCS